MNRETTLINNHIESHDMTKVKELRQKYNNIKDFQVMFGYLVMDIVNTNKALMNIKRKEIDLPELAKKFFEKGLQ